MDGAGAGEDGGRLGGAGSLPALDFTVSIDHRYPIADDEDAERTLDLQEVSQQARSRKSYLEKWQPDADGNVELAQIASEQKKCWMTGSSRE